MENTGWENQPPVAQVIKSNNIYTNQNNPMLNGMYYDNYNQQNDNGQYFSTSESQVPIPQSFETQENQYYRQKMQIVPQKDQYVQRLNTVQYSTTPQIIQTQSASSNQIPQLMSDQLDSIDEYSSTTAQYQNFNQNANNYYNPPKNQYQLKNAQLLQNNGNQQSQLQSYPTPQGEQSHSFSFSTTSEEPQNQFSMNQPSAKYLDINQNPNSGNNQGDKLIQVSSPSKQYLTQSQKQQQELESQTSTLQSQLNSPSRDIQEISPQLPSSIPSMASTQFQPETDLLFQESNANTVILKESENMKGIVNSPSQDVQGFQNQMFPTSNSMLPEPLLSQKQQKSELQLPTTQSLNRPLQNLQILSSPLPLISSFSQSLLQPFQQPYSQPQSKQGFQNQFIMNKYQPTTTEMSDFVENPITSYYKNQPALVSPTTSSQLLQPLKKQQNYKSELLDIPPQNLSPQLSSIPTSESQPLLFQSHSPPQNVHRIQLPPNINQLSREFLMPNTGVSKDQNGAFMDNSQMELENKLNNNTPNKTPFNVLQNDSTQTPSEGDGRNSKIALDQVQINPLEKSEISNLLEMKDVNESPIINGIMINDNDKLHNGGDIEDLKKTDGNNSLQVYSNYNDSDINRFKLLSTQSPTSVSSFLDNNVDDQRYDSSPYQPINELLNNQNPNLNTYNGKMSTSVSEDADQNRPIPTYNNGYVNDKVSLQNPSPSHTSCLLKKRRRQKNNVQAPNRNSGASVSETMYNPIMNNNNHRVISNSSLNDYLLAQNMMTVISNALQIPNYGMKAIFDAGRSNFPNIQIAQQFSLTYAVIQSIVVGLRKAANSIRNSMTVSFTSAIIENLLIVFCF